MSNSELREVEPKTHSVYVVELSDDVLKHKRFCKENPDRDDGKACLYVGMTSRTPEERLQQHLSGYKACSYVKRYGKCLCRRLYEKFNPLTRNDAAKLERRLARRLRKTGYAVWQK